MFFRSKNLHNPGIVQRIFGIFINVQQSRDCAICVLYPWNSGFSRYKQSDVELLPTTLTAQFACFYHPTPT